MVLVVVADSEPVVSDMVLALPAVRTQPMVVCSERFGVRVLPALLDDGAIPIIAARHVLSGAAVL